MDKLSSGLKAKILNLLHHLYIDRSPFEKLDVPNYLRVWDLIEDPDKVDI